MFLEPTGIARRWEEPLAGTGCYVEGAVSPAPGVGRVVPAPHSHGEAPTTRTAECELIWKQGHECTCN